MRARGTENVAMRATQYQNRTSLSLQQPSGVWTNKFIYDLAGRLTNVTSAAGVFGYTLGGASSASPLTKKLLLPNSSYITNTFDNVARLTGTFLDNSTGGILDSAAYGFNQANQRTTYTNAAGTRVQYFYDNIGQLKVGDSSVNTEDRGYYYDAAWNLNCRIFRHSPYSKRTRPKTAQPTAILSDSNSYHSSNETNADAAHE